MRRRVAIPLLLLAMWSHASGAQRPAGTAAAACTPVPVIESEGEQRIDTLFAVAALGHQAPDTARVYALYLLDELAREFRLPEPFAFPVWSVPDTLRPEVAVPALAMEAEVVIAADGRLRGIAMTQTSLDRALDASLAAALRRVVEGAGMPRPEALGVRKDMTLFVSLTFDRQLDAAAPPPGAQPAKTPAPARRVVAQPLSRLARPTARFSTQLLADHRRSSAPRYPLEFRREERDGDVTIELVVGPDGTVVPGTTRLIDATERAFAEAVFASIKGQRYRPAEIGGCPVPVLSRMSFSFRIDR